MIFYIKYIFTFGDNSKRCKRHWSYSFSVCSTIISNFFLSLFFRHLLGCWWGWQMVDVSTISFVSLFYFQFLNVWLYWTWMRALATEKHWYNNWLLMHSIKTCSWAHDLISTRSLKLAYCSLLKSHIIVSIAMK